MSTPTIAPEPTLRLELTAKLFRGFADPSRLSLLAVLRQGEACVSDLVAHTGLTQSNVSSHLACLRDCGLVASRQQGRYVFYRLADDGVESILSSADAVLSRHAGQIATCVNEHMFPAVTGQTPPE